MHIKIRPGVDAAHPTLGLLAWPYQRPHQQDEGNQGGSSEKPQATLTDPSRPLPICGLPIWSGAVW